jgi:hypothetical protein
VTSQAIAIALAPCTAVPIGRWHLKHIQAGMDEFLECSGFSNPEKMFAYGSFPHYKGVIINSALKLHIYDLLVSSFMPKMKRRQVLEDYRKIFIPADTMNIGLKFSFKISVIFYQIFTPPTANGLH